MQTTLLNFLNTGSLKNNMLFRCIRYDMSEGCPAKVLNMFRDNFAALTISDRKSSKE